MAHHVRCASAAPVTAASTSWSEAACTTPIGSRVAGFSSGSSSASSRAATRAPSMKEVYRRPALSGSVTGACVAVEAVTARPAR